MLNNIGRHISVWREAWKVEKEARKARRPIHEKDFLPAALEIMEKPPSPIGRALLWSILAFFSLAVLWSIFGKVDEVAVATGRIIPRDQVKLVQPLETGIVRAIYVHDGQKVRAGDVLIELDPTETGANEEQAQQQLLTAELQEARSAALLEYLETGKISFKPQVALSNVAYMRQERVVRAKIRAYEAEQASYLEQRAEAEAEISSIEQEIKKIEQTLPLIQEQVRARRILLEKGLTPRLMYLELKEREVTQIQDLEIQQHQHIKAKAEARSIDQQINRLTEELRSEAATDMADSSDQVAMARAELDKVAERRQRQTLKAPVSGVVQQLIVHTVGGVVEPAKALMVIVPGEGELIVEAMVLNKDIGFVQEGDTVEVKLEAFPFTKYGVIDGVLETLSLDAVQDEHLGLVYTAKVRLKAQDIMVRGRRVPLSSGMVASAEMKTGQKRLIEYIISPLLRYRDEAMRER